MFFYVKDLAAARVQSSFLQWDILNKQKVTLNAVTEGGG